MWINPQWAWYMWAQRWPRSLFKLQLGVGRINPNLCKKLSTSSGSFSFINPCTLLGTILTQLSFIMIPLMLMLIMTFMPWSIQHLWILKLTTIEDYYFVFIIIFSLLFIFIFSHSWYEDWTFKFMCLGQIWCLNDEYLIEWKSPIIFLWNYVYLM